MFIPPVHSHNAHTTVVNNIVYSDTVLPVKDLGNNLKVTSISGVSESSLEDCLKIIFESNPNVVFNTVQYSKNDKKVYFYTNKEIRTEAYEERKLKKLKPITTNPEILEEVKNILNLQKNKNSNCVSLYDVSQLLKKLKHDYNMIEINYESQFKSVIKSIFSDKSSIIIYDFDYKNKLLKMGFRKWSLGDYEKISFAKENDDLYIAKSECFYDKEVFNVLSSDLSKLYDEFMSFTDYKDDYKSKFNTKAVNSRFGVSISQYGVGIFVNSKINPHQKDFELSSPSYDEKYSLKCNSSIVNEAFKNNEDEIFKRIFVRIEDCPEWSKKMLYEIRKNQLLEEQKIEDEEKYKEMRKQKRLELKRKLFPFLKK